MTSPTPPYARAILPGTRVRVGTTLLGTVERMEEAPSPSAQGSLVVRADDGSTHWRFSLTLVVDIVQEAEHAVTQTVVQLALDPADLERYRMRDEDDSIASVAQSAGMVQSAMTPGDTLRVPLFAEQLIVETRPVQRGTVHLRKSVQTTEQHLTTSLAHDEISVEHIPVDEFDPHAPGDPDDIIIPVVEERVVVETRAVIVEYIRVRKHRVTTDQDVQATVRRDVVTVEATPLGEPDGLPLLRDHVETEVRDRPPT